MNLAEERLKHYRYRWIAKTSGGRRLLEVPKPRLKAIHRRILKEILDQISWSSGSDSRNGNCSGIIFFASVTNLNIAR